MGHGLCRIATATTTFREEANEQVPNAGRDRLDRIRYRVPQSHAVVIDFTGGTVTFPDTSTATTNNAVLHGGVDYYEEGGFKLDFIGGNEYIGTYYPAANDVIHGHWVPFGGLTSVEITKVGGGSFDLNYFRLTSNTQVGGGPATGLEKAFVEGFSNAAGTISTGPPVMLPSENWGFPSSQIFLGPAFNAVQVVKFYVDNMTDPVFCFGMDEFFIDEPAPEPDVPEPTAIGMMLLSTIGLMCVAQRKRRS